MTSYSSFSCISLTSKRPKQGIGGLPRAALRAGRLQALLKLINQAWWYFVPCHHGYRDKKGDRGVNSIFSNFSHHSLCRLNKEQDSKTHCPVAVAQGTVVCSGFFCIFALNFGYSTVLNNLRVFCCSMLKCIFDSVQILLHHQSYWFFMD